MLQLKSSAPVTHHPLQCMQQKITEETPALVKTPGPAISEAQYCTVTCKETQTTRCVHACDDRQSITTVCIRKAGLV